MRRVLSRVTTGGARKIDETVLERRLMALCLMKIRFIEVAY